MKPNHLANRGCREYPRPTLAADWSCDESGQDIIEYALLTSVLSIAFVGMIQTLANGIIPFFDRIIAAFP
jgi:Flp pilus assembly pilin Flp